ncbi:heavy metal-responsive transcriptional regulator [Nocardiopsis rhodophaea]|uniref:heavy metal-responsive transcriptional regulator n=1 Tax=Nocardiopsis rhodophaea TaxID=280238 RepID=UPI0031D00491
MGSGEVIGVRIGELAAQLRVNPKTIRYYEGIGLLPPAERTAAGYRVYTEADAERVAFIKSAQRLGVRLDEIREILAFRDRGERPCGYVRATVLRQVADIDQRIADLQRLRDDLVALDALADQLPEQERAGSEASGQDPGCPLIEHACGHNVEEGHLADTFGAIRQGRVVRTGESATAEAGSRRGRAVPR